MHVQGLYEAHRNDRNARFKEKLLDEHFTGWKVDEILQNLLTSPTFTDHRHNLNFYARPPRHIKQLVAEVQAEIREVAPTLWFYPPETLHLTTVEIASSRTKSEIDALATHLQSTGTAQTLVEYTFEHRARLVKPTLSFDDCAMALSFVPAAPGDATNIPGRSADDDGYTYDRLRRDLSAKIREAGVEIAPRYSVPSAHVTIARFVSLEGFLGDGGEGVDRGRVREVVERIERVNAMLRERYWPRARSVDGEDAMPMKGEWVVGQEEGLEFNKGTSWYGGGERVLVGRGFP